MADSHPFATAGLNQFGADKNYAFGGDSSGGLGAKLLGMFLDQSGIKDFLNNNNLSIPSGAVPPTSQQSLDPNQYAMTPAMPVSNQGINPLKLPIAPIGGTGMNAKPFGVPPMTSPFNGQSNPFAPQQQIDPNIKRIGEIVKAWEQ